MFRKFHILNKELAELNMNYKVKRMLFPEGRLKAFTVSYDDGITQDKRLVEILNKYGIRGTFNINSGCFGQQDQVMVRGVKVNHSHIPADEIQELYKNNEVAIHTLTHPNLKELPKEIAIYEIMDDKKNLEELVGYPVRGMAYPYGAYDSKVLKTLKELKIEYSRVVSSQNTFKLPEDFLQWGPTCHHKDKEIFNLINSFNEAKELSLFYVWGHSYELDVEDKWDFIEEVYRAVSNNPEVWYATNIEIVYYINAVNSLKFSTLGSSVYNPSGLDIWISINGTAYKIEKGTVKKIVI